jgi:hypothetical protein
LGASRASSRGYFALAPEEEDMFGSTALDVGAGLVVLYFILGAVCSHINELLAGLFGWRASHLEAGIRTLLADPDLATRVWQHPIIRSLAGRSGRDPSYVPAKIFAQVLFDELAPVSGAPPTIATIHGAVGSLPDSGTKRSLVAILTDAQQDVTAARRGVEDWYNAAMDRVTGVYKRQIQVVTLALSLFVAVGLGVDTVAIAQSLWQEPALRAALASAGQTAAASGLEDPLGTLTQFDLPLGWRALPETLNGWLLKIVGLALTTFAVSLGAPFWFDVLKKIGNPRLAGPNSDEKK